MSYTRIEDNGTYKASLIQVARLANREMRILDGNFLAMDIESASMRQALVAFLERRNAPVLRIALRDATLLLTRMPRTLEIFQRFTHCVEVRHIPVAYHEVTDCHLLVDSCHGVRRFHADHARGALIIDDLDEIRPWWNRFADLWEQSHIVSITSATGL